MAVTRSQTSKKRSRLDAGAADQQPTKKTRAASARNIRKVRKTECDLTDGDLSAPSQPVPLPKEFAKTTKPDNPLMRLPGELRNEIYRLVLVSNNQLLVTKSSIPTQPPLTMVSRQIRKEAIAIFYRENKFGVEVVNNDGRHEGVWLVKIGWENMKLLDFSRIHEDYYVFLFSQNSTDPWKNLLQWLKDFYHYKAGSPVSGPDRENRTRPITVLMLLFSAADELREDKTSWETAEKVLTIVGEVAECKRPNWKPEVE